ncbi:MAG: hypothetical protein JXR59_06530 [Desulfuromonadaceae bacterium]|nr:hypothetical protein [Desulfuromonadaceae bacterium]
MKKLWMVLGLLLAMTAPAFAVDFAFHGDLKNQFRLYSNQTSFFTAGGKTYKQNLIQDDDNTDFYGALKYRLWVEAASDDGAVKGVYAIELGALHFGDANYSKGGGGGFSGDGVNIETRWAYTDFALAGGRARVGLMSIDINKFLWNETVTGVDYKVSAGAGELTLGWYRGYEVVNTGDNDFKDMDALYVRYNLKPAEDIKIGFFALWQTSDADTLADGETVPDFTAHQYLGKKLTGLDIDLYTLGVDGGMKAGDFFANWDLMYQFGDMLEDADFGGYFAHIDLGVKLGNGKLTYTGWYASGDDDASDDDLDAFISTDVDLTSAYSVVLFEGYTDDDYFNDAPYLMDKGLIFNRLAFDYKVSDKMKVGVAALYMMTAEDIEYTSSNGAESEDKIGFEFDAYASYKLFKSTEIGFEFGYLMADDAMDYYEVECDGNADEDIFVINSRIRYKF